MREAKKLAGEEDLDKISLLDSDEVVTDPMPHLQKKWPEFQDQDESINQFLEQIKQLIFLGKRS